MKLSELKKQIKDNIYEILSEEPVDEGTYVGVGAVAALQKDPKFAAAKDKNTALNTLKTGGSVTLQEADPAAIKAIGAKIQNDPEFLKKTKDAMAKAEKGDTTSSAILPLVAIRELVKYTPMTYKVHMNQDNKYLKENHLNILLVKFDTIYFIWCKERILNDNNEIISCDIENAPQIYLKIIEHFINNKWIDYIFPYKNEDDKNNYLNLLNS